MAKMLLLRSSEGKVLMAPTWDKRPSATQALPVQTGIPSRALERVVQFWTKHALAPATGEPAESLARWDADFSRRLRQDGLDAEFAAAIRELRLASQGRRPEATRHPVAAAAPTDAAPAARAAGAGQGQVFVWCRPIRPDHGDEECHARASKTRAAAAAAAAAPTDAAPAARAAGAGQGQVYVWCRPIRPDHGDEECHARASKTRAAVAAAARSDLAVAWCAAARPDHASALRAAGAGPVDVWCAFHARGDAVPVASPDRAAASRAHGRQRAEDEESACHHRKRPLAKMTVSVAPKSCSSVGSAPAPAATSQKMTVPASLSLRARRGLPELSCKCPKQIPLLAASRKIRN